MKVNHLFRFLHSHESGKLGNVLFVSGAGLLSFSAVCLMRTSESYLQIQNTALILFWAAVALLLTGETMRALAGHDQGRLWSLARFLGNIRIRRPVAKVERVLTDATCHFCGRTAGSASVSRKGEGRAAYDRDAFVRCLNCGKTVCPRCAYLKGLEMDRKSLRCPECGGQVY